ncbi:hypothetical protein CDL15_Pgr021830 [Punica granatum]|uniref:Iron-binding zinc finger CDGSH type domain-containing protein n=1 Tax=Punica granatum TaxID=22663 RepID=A0A218WSA1_PUNGR|nr:hypothetical protein CDL15_Pgr021830 [Punica granatum]PKI38365.1 hypothetical protein CRG98_041276 [Punica granatum]
MTSAARFHLQVQLLERVVSTSSVPLPPPNLQYRLHFTRPDETSSEDHFPMASLLSVPSSAAFSQGLSVPNRARPRRSVVVRAEAAGTINTAIRKEEDKVVDSVVVTELSKPLTAYCRCWRSGTFPLCDGGHVKHNKATGDNVGPLLLKKQ